MDNIKKHWKEILIVILVLFGITKCAQSCNRAGAYDILNNETAVTISKKDSIIHVLEDSISTLNTTIKVYEEKVQGLNTSLAIQNDATKKISEAKKNISINVRQK